MILCFLFSVDAYQARLLLQWMSDQDIIYCPDDPNSYEILADGLNFEDKNEDDNEIKIFGDDSDP